MKLVVTNIEQSQPSERTDTLIHIFGRTIDAPDERQEVVVYGFDPYFYAPADAARENEDWLLGQQAISKIEYDVSVDPFNADRELAKVYPPYPQDTRHARDLFDNTWAADVPFTRRFRIDTGIKAYAYAPDTDCHWQEIEPIEPPATASSGV